MDASPSNGSGAPRTWGELHVRQRDERIAFLEAALRAHRGNRTDTARATGIDRCYLVRLIREHGIDVSVDPALRTERARARWARRRGATSGASA